LTSLCVTTDLVGTQLTCSATAADAEGDPITIDYQWTVTDLTGQETYSTDQSITYDPMSTGSAMCEATPSDTFEYGNPVSVDAELSVDGSVCADLGLTASVDFGGATCLEEGRSNVGCDYTLHGFDSITETDASFVEYTLNGVPAERYEQLEAGIDHACAIESSTGAVHCWGDIHGSVASDAVLISFSDPGEGGFFASLDVGAGDDHGVAITVEETSGTWGIASGGGSMVSGTSVAVVAGDDFTCTLASNGALDCFGDQVIKNAVDADNTANLTTYSALAAGHGSGAEGAVCGIRTNIPQGEDSSLKCFDKSSNSTLLKTDVPAGTDWVFVSVAARSACAVDSANSMQCWGPNVPTAGVFSDVEQGVMSENGGCRVSTDGNLQCLYGGAGAAPEAPPPGQYTDIVSGFAGGSYFCATSVAGTIHCWGTAAPATHSTETVYMAPGLGELQDGDTLECTVTPCADDGSSETCGDPVTAMIQVADTCP